MTIIEAKKVLLANGDFFEDVYVRKHGNSGFIEVWTGADEMCLIDRAAILYIVPYMEPQGFTVPAVTKIHM